MTQAGVHVCANSFIVAVDCFVCVSSSRCSRTRAEVFDRNAYAMSFEPTQKVLGQPRIRARVLLPSAASDVKLHAEGALAQGAGPDWTFPDHVAFETRLAGGFGQPFGVRLVIQPLNLNVSSPATPACAASRIWPYRTFGV